MLDFKNRLFVFHDDNSVFVDHSNDSFDFSRNSYLLPLVSAEDFLYIGFRKPINTFYVDMKVVSTETTFTAEYFNGTTFTSLSNFFDDSRGFSRSGFVRWDRNQTDEAATTIDGQEAFWYKLKPAADFGEGAEVQGLNILFSDDQDLNDEFDCINDYLSDNRTSFVLFHQSAKRDIIQELRNKRSNKRSSTKDLEDITEWDVLDTPQINQASKYLVLSKIFFNISDNVEDKYYQFFRDYDRKYKESFPVGILRLDEDDDGLTDNSEARREVITRIVRI